MIGHYASDFDYYEDQEPGSTTTPDPPCPDCGAPADETCREGCACHWCEIGDGECIATGGLDGIIPF